MDIAVIDNGAISEIRDYRELFPNVSFSEKGPSESFLQQNDCMVVMRYKQHDPKTQKLVKTPPYIDSGKVYTVTVEALTQEDLDKAESDRKAVASSSARAKRDRLLSSSDWTQLEDCPQANKQSWKTYRQALRDIPQQAGFPDSIVWPTVPGSSIPNNNGAI